MSALSNETKLKIEKTIKKFESKQDGCLLL